MSQTLRQTTLVATVASLVMFTNLGGPRLWDRDEPRNAECAAEMQARGDWVTPTMNGELRAHKPVLQYWLMMSAYSVFGVNEFSARFWSAALAVGTVLCTFVIGRRLFDNRVGTWAGIILATVLMFDVAGRAATPDSPLVFFTTLAMMLFVLGTFARHDESRPAKDVAERHFPSWAWSAAMYGAMGFAVLAKGPVCLVLPTAVVGMYLLVVRLPGHRVEPSGRGWWYRVKRAASCFGPSHFLQTCWLMRPITALGVSLAVALPWYIWVGVRTDGQFLRGFLFDHHFVRATQSMEGHSGPIFFYPIAILVGFFPWSVFALPVALDAIRHGKQNISWRAGYIFSACWIGVFVGLFSIAETKLPSYVTPCYPALALVTGCFVDRWSRNVLTTSRHWFRVACGITSLVGLGILVGVSIAAHLYLGGDEWLGAIGLVPIAAGVITLVYSERNQPHLATRTFGGFAVLFTTLVFAGAADRISRHQRNEVLLDAIAARGADVPVASYGLLEPSWIFYMRRPIDELTVQDLSVLQPTWVERNGRWVRKPSLSVNDLRNRSEDCLIITSDEYLPRLREELPEGYEVLAKAPYFLREGNLLLVEPTNPSRVARNQPAIESTLPR